VQIDVLHIAVLLPFRVVDGFDLLQFLLGDEGGAVEDAVHLQHDGNAPEVHQSLEHGHLDLAQLGVVALEPENGWIEHYREELVDYVTEMDIS